MLDGRLEAAGLVGKKRKSGGAMVPYPKAKWGQVRTSFFEDGVTNARKLAVLHGVTLGSLQMRMRREGWRKKLAARMDRAIEERKVKESEGTIEDLIRLKREGATRQMIESVVTLLEKTHQRISLLQATDGSEITEMIGAVKNLQVMLDGLMGEGKAGGAVAANKGKVQVNILAQVLEAADRQAAGGRIRITASDQTGGGGDESGGKASTDG